MRPIGRIEFLPRRAPDRIRLPQGTRQARCAGRKARGPGKAPRPSQIAAYAHTGSKPVRALSVNEAETGAELIDPTLKAAGWGVVEGSNILREYSTTLGRRDGAYLLAEGPD
jgi:hypothetical protein